MIKDRLEFAENYFTISEKLKAGFDWLMTNDLVNLEPGRYELNNSSYANIQVYNTKPDAEFEAHKKYIDIQYVAQGAELVGISNLKNCVVSQNYNEENDIEFYQSDADAQYYELHEGEFMVLFPNDIHKPSINLHKEGLVKKIVVKIPIN